MTARVVYERNDGFDMQAGPYGYERVGFSIGDRIFWTGCAGSGMPGTTFEADKALAEAIVARWNCGHADGVCSDCHTHPALGHPTQYETSCRSCLQRANDLKWGEGR